MKSIKFFFVGVLIGVSLQTHAGYSGKPEFSEREIEIHKNRIDEFLRVSKDCLENHRERHLDFYRDNCGRTRSGKKVCVSKFYGDRRYSMRRNQRRSDGQLLEYLPDALKRSGFDPSLANEMESTSCIGLALECLRQGFRATDQIQQWDKLRSYVYLNNVGGTSLQDGLQKLGWNIHYWNPSPLSDIIELAQKWDAEEKGWQSKGWHEYRYYRVRNDSQYWYNTVDNKWDLVGFLTSTPRKLYRYPFWVGTAHTGYHVFPGTYGQVVEAHSTRHFTSVDNLEFSNFNPLDPSGKGGPRWSRTEKYRSGLIALPPVD